MSAVGMATGYELEKRGIGVRDPVGSVLFSLQSGLALGHNQHPIQRIPKALSRGVKRQERRAYHSYSTSAEVKKAWIYTVTLP
jgi:hypothetical protein